MCTLPAGEGTRIDMFFSTGLGFQWASLLVTGEGIRRLLARRLRRHANRRLRYASTKRIQNAFSTGVWPEEAEATVPFDSVMSEAGPNFTHNVPRLRTSLVGSLQDWLSRAGERPPKQRPQAPYCAVVCSMCSGAFPCVEIKEMWGYSVSCATSPTSEAYRLQIFTVLQSVGKHFTRCVSCRSLGYLESILRRPFVVTCKGAPAGPWASSLIWTWCASGSERVPVRVVHFTPCGRYRQEAAFGGMFFLQLDDIALAVRESRRKTWEFGFV